MAGGFILAAVCKRSHAYGRVAFVIAALLLAMVAGAFAGFRGAMATRTVLSGVRVGGINIEGMRYDEVRHVLSSRLGERLNRGLLINWGWGQQFIVPAAAGISLDADEIALQALAVGRRGSWLQQFKERWQTWQKGYNLSYEFQVSPQFDIVLATLTSQMNKPPVNAQFKALPNGDVEVSGGLRGQKVDAAELKESILAAIYSGKSQLWAPVSAVEPEVTTAKAHALGIRKVVSAYSTKFNAGDFNRSENIRLASQALNGALIGPGEVFSFNKRVGPRIASLGYKEAPVVVEGELVPDIGGGVCQVSSTLYNAVLLANLRVDSRVPHSIPSTYVELGRDATVVYDYIDFRFVNNTQGHLLVQAQVIENQLEITLLGQEKATPTRLVSRIEVTTPAPVIEVEDITLPPGQKEVKQKGGTGYVVSVWRVIQEPEERWELIGRTTYKPRPRVIRVGP
jgi:vancomycin resistance protein YoaR